MPENTVKADGHAEVTREPDAARIVMGVESESGDREDTIEEFNETAFGIQSTLKDEFNLDDGQVNTISYNFRTMPENPHRRDASGGERFGGAHYFEVEVYDTDLVGDVLSAAFEEGVSVVQDVEYMLTEERREVCNEEALEKALASARKDAEVAVNFENYELDGVVEFDLTETDTNSSSIDVGTLRQMSMQSSSGTEVNPDDVSVEVSVEVVYEFV